MVVTTKVFAPSWLFLAACMISSSDGVSLGLGGLRDSDWLSQWRRAPDPETIADRSSLSLVNPVDLAEQHRSPRSVSDSASSIIDHGLTGGGGTGGGGSEDLSSSDNDDGIVCTLRGSSLVCGVGITSGDASVGNENGDSTGKSDSDSSESGESMTISAISAPMTTAQTNAAGHGDKDGRGVGCSRVGGSNTGGDSDRGSSHGRSSRSSDSSSDDDDCCKKVLTQRCYNEPSILRARQEGEFMLIRDALQRVSIAELVLSTRMMIAEGNTLVFDKRQQACVTGVNNTDSSGMVRIRSSHGFLLELRQTVQGRDSPVGMAPIPFTDINLSYIFNNLPESFGTLQIDFSLDSDSQLMPGSENFRFRVGQYPDDKVFDLELPSRECALERPLICPHTAIREPNPTGIPYLYAKAEDEGAADQALAEAICR